MMAELPDVNIRTPNVNCTSGNIVFTLRVTDFTVVEDIYRLHREGKLNGKLSGALSEGLNQILNSSTYFTANTSMSVQEISEYKDVFLPFQSKYSWR